VVWDRSVEVPSTTVYIAELAVPCYGPLPEAMGRQYLAQRCRNHDHLDAEAFCDPEWELFEPRLHRHLGTTPRYPELFGADRTIPPPAIVVLALREHCTPAERRMLAARLAADEFE
jgi:hypothetical protein